MPGKNVRVLAGHPAIAYTIAPAVESGVFQSVIVSTDSEEVAAIARHYGAEVPFLRPAAFAGDTSPDTECSCAFLFGRADDEVVGDIDYSSDVANQIADALLLQRRPHLAGHADDTVRHVDANVTLTKKSIELDAVD